jgi:cytochrome c551/c552
MKNIFILLYTFFFACMLFLASCNNQSAQKEEDDKVKAASDQKALTLLQRNCFSCHSPEKGHGTRVAPPIEKVRQHYFDTEISKDDFAKKIIHFINNPSEENSIMPGAVRNFGLMPKLSYKEEDLILIAAYMYDNNLESDEWYAKWEAFKKTAPTVEESLSYEDMGLNYANGTKSELGKNLLAAIKEFGPEGAVKFCNIRAMPLTDSMAKVFNASIKRVSDKPRNPNNTANETEVALIQELKTKAANKEKLNPRVIEEDGKVIGYYPIQTNKMCLQCHGKTGTDINKATLANIKKLYPKDKATGYGENEIRGLFVVEMNRK